MVSLGGQSIVQAFALRVSSVRLEQQYQGATLSCCSSDSVVTSACDWTDVRPFVPPQRYRSTSPADSLKKGEWFKLICGASFEVGGVNPKIVKSRMPSTRDVVKIFDSHYVYSYLRVRNVVDATRCFFGFFFGVHGCEPGRVLDGSRPALCQTLSIECRSLIFL